MNKHFSAKSLSILAIFLLVLLLTACSGNNSSSATTETTPGAAVSFSKDVLPIFTTNCTTCHTAGNATNGVALNDYSNVIGSKVIVAGNVDGSKLVREIQSGRMPPGGKLSASNIQKIVDWINQGALEN